MGGSTKIRKDRNTLEAEKTISAEYRQDIDNFVSNVMPLVNKQIGSLDDNSMVKQAVGDNKQNAAMAEGMQNRNTARYGLGMSSNQRNALTRQRKQDVAANSAGNENNARLVQKDRNENVALGLASMGNSYRQDGMNDMMSAVGLGSNRAMNNANSASQAKQQNLGTAASLATMAFMAM